MKFNESRSQQGRKPELPSLSPEILKNISPELAEKFLGAKIVVLDLDGCLIPTNSPEDLKDLASVISELRQQGVLVLVNTGRPAAYAQGLIRPLFSLSSDTWNVAEHGGCIFPIGDGQKVIDLIPKKDQHIFQEIEKALKKFLEQEDFITFEEGKTRGLALFPRECHTLEGKEKAAEVRELREVIESLLKRLKLLQFVSPSNKRINDEKDRQIAYITTSSLAVDILPIATNKLTALQLVLALNAVLGNVKDEEKKKLKEKYSLSFESVGLFLNSLTKFSLTEINQQDNMELYLKNKFSDEQSRRFFSRQVAVLKSMLTLGEKLLADTIYVGDSEGDWPVMQSEKVGLITCPANADPETKKLVRKRGGYVASGSTTSGVAEILQILLSIKNKK